MSKNNLRILLCTLILFSLSVFQTVGQKKTTLESYQKELAVHLGTTFPEWSLPNLNNDTIHSRDFKGKVVLIDFWGAGCGPCVKIEPDLKKIHDTYKMQGFEFISIESSKWSKIDRIKTICNKYGVYHNTLIKGFSLADKFGIHGYPTLFLFDRDGKIQYIHVGLFAKPNQKQKMIEEIEKALAVPNN
jgi:thiol-disulfide isomerase/thioredoxin